MISPRAPDRRVWFFGLTAFASGVLLTSLVVLATTNAGRSTYMTAVGMALHQQRLDLSSDAATVDLCNRMARDFGEDAGAVGIAAADLGVAMKRDIQYFMLADRWAQFSAPQKLRFILTGVPDGEITLMNTEITKRKGDLQGSLRLANFLEICAYHP